MLIHSHLNVNQKSDQSIISLMQKQMTQEFLRKLKPGDYADIRVEDSLYAMRLVQITMEGFVFKHSSFVQSRNSLTIQSQNIFPFRVQTTPEGLELQFPQPVITYSTFIKIDNIKSQIMRIIDDFSQHDAYNIIQTIRGRLFYLVRSLCTLKVLSQSLYATSLRQFFEVLRRLCFQYIKKTKFPSRIDEKKIYKQSQTALASCYKQISQLLFISTGYHKLDKVFVQDKLEKFQTRQEIGKWIQGQFLQELSGTAYWNFPIEFTRHLLQLVLATNKLVQYYEQSHKQQDRLFDLMHNLHVLKFNEKATRQKFNKLYDLFTYFNQIRYFDRKVLSIEPKPTQKSQQFEDIDLIEIAQQSINKYLSNPKTQQNIQVDSQQQQNYISQGLLEVKHKTLMLFRLNYQLDFFLNSRPNQNATTTQPRNELSFLNYVLGKRIQGNRNQFLEMLFSDPLVCKKLDRLVEKLYRVCPGQTINTLLIIERYYLVQNLLKLQITDQKILLQTSSSLLRVEVEPRRMEDEKAIKQMKQLCQLLIFVEDKLKKNTIYSIQRKQIIQKIFSVGRNMKNLQINLFQSLLTRKNHEHDSCLKECYQKQLSKININLGRIHSQLEEHILQQDCRQFLQKDSGYFEQLCAPMVVEQTCNLLAYKIRQDTIMKMLQNYYRNNSTTYQRYFEVYFNSYCSQPHKNMKKKVMRPQQKRKNISIDPHKQIKSSLFEFSSNQYCRQKINEIQPLSSQFDVVCFNDLYLRLISLQIQKLYTEGHETQSVSEIQEEYLGASINMLYSLAYLALNEQNQRQKDEVEGLKPIQEYNIPIFRKYKLQQSYIHKFILHFELEQEQKMLTKFAQILVDKERDSDPKITQRVIGTLKIMKTKYYTLSEYQTAHKIYQKTSKIPRQPQVKYKVNFQNEDFKKKKQQYCERDESKKLPILVEQKTNKLFSLRSGEKLINIRLRLAVQLNRQPTQIRFLMNTSQELNQKDLKKSFNSLLGMLIQTQYLDQIKKWINQPQQKIPIINIKFRFKQSSLLENYLMKCLLIRKIQQNLKIGSIFRKIDLRYQNFQAYNETQFGSSIQEAISGQYQVLENIMKKPVLNKLVLDYFFWLISKQQLHSIDFAKLLKAYKPNQLNVLENYKMAYVIAHSGNYENLDRQQLYSLLKNEWLEKPEQLQLYGKLNHLVIQILSQCGRVLQFYFSTSQLQKIYKIKIAQEILKNHLINTFVSTDKEGKVAFFDFIFANFESYTYRNIFLLFQLIQKIEADIYNDLVEKLVGKMITIVSVTNPALPFWKSIKELLLICYQLFKKKPDIEVPAFYSQPFSSFLVRNIYYLQPDMSQGFFQLLFTAANVKSNCNQIAISLSTQIERMQWNKLIEPGRVKIDQNKSILIPGSAFQSYDLTKTPVGLKNPKGLLCYANSFLQQLYHTVEFRRQVLQTSNWNKHPQDSKDFFFQLKLIFEELQNGSSEVNENFFRRAFLLKDWTNGKLSEYPIGMTEQRDVNEFQIHFFQHLENSLLADNFHKQMFYGQQVYEAKCNTENCPQTSSYSSQFHYLQLIVQGQSKLQQSYKIYREANQQEYDKKCQRCGNTKGTIKSQIKRLPRHLIFLLNRFKFDKIQQKTFKFLNRFQFPFDQLKLSHQTFQLKGVICHIGQRGQEGHYISYRLIQNIWYEFNDEKVTKVSQNDVERQCFGSDATGLYQIISTAYVLFYEKLEKKTEQQIGWQMILPQQPQEAFRPEQMEQQMVMEANREYPELQRAIPTTNQEEIQMQEFGDPITQEEHNSAYKIVQREEKNSFARKLVFMKWNFLKFILKLIKEHTEFKILQLVLTSLTQIFFRIKQIQNYKDILQHPLIIQCLFQLKRHGFTQLIQKSEDKQWSFFKSMLDSDSPSEFKSVLATLLATSCNFDINKQLTKKLLDFCLASIRRQNNDISAIYYLLYEMVSKSTNAMEYVYNTDCVNKILLTMLTDLQFHKEKECDMINHLKSLTNEQAESGNIQQQTKRQTTKPTLSRYKWQLLFKLVQKDYRFLDKQYIYFTTEGVYQKYFEADETRTETKYRAKYLYYVFSFKQQISFFQQQFKKLGSIKYKFPAKYHLTMNQMANLSRRFNPQVSSLICRTLLENANLNGQTLKLKQRIISTKELEYFQLWFLKMIRKNKTIMKYFYNHLPNQEKKKDRLIKHLKKRNPLTLEDWQIIKEFSHRDYRLHGIAIPTSAEQVKKMHKAKQIQILYYLYKPLYQKEDQINSENASVKDDDGFFSEQAAVPESMLIYCDQTQSFERIKVMFSYGELIFYRYGEASHTKYIFRGDQRLYLRQTQIESVNLQILYTSIQDYMTDDQKELCKYLKPS